MAQHLSHSFIQNQFVVRDTTLGTEVERCVGKTDGVLQEFTVQQGKQTNK